MHQMQPIATDVRGVCLSVSLSRGSTRLRCAKTAEWIEMLFGVNTPGDTVLQGGSGPPWEPTGHCVTKGSWSPTDRGRKTYFYTLGSPSYLRNSPVSLTISYVFNYVLFRCTVFLYFIRVFLLYIISGSCKCTTCLAVQSHISVST